MEWQENPANIAILFPKNGMHSLEKLNDMPDRCQQNLKQYQACIYKYCFEDSNGYIFQKNPEDQ